MRPNDRIQHTPARRGGLAGIRQRHGNRCARPASGCKCPWQAEVYSTRDGKKIRKLFPTKGAARDWRNDATTAVRRRIMGAPTSTTLREAAKAWLEGARAGVALPDRDEPDGRDLRCAHPARPRPSTPLSLRLHQDQPALPVRDQSGFQLLPAFEFRNALVMIRG